MRPSRVASRLPGATTKADLEIAAHAYQALKEDIETKVSRLRANSWLYRAGRVAGTREIVVRSIYVVVYAKDANTFTVLRVLHGAQLRPQP